MMVGDLVRCRKSGNIGVIIEWNDSIGILPVHVFFADGRYEIHEPDELEVINK
jgi:hypothetical protein